MKLFDVTFKLDSVFPELKSILPVLNNMARDGNRLTVDARTSHTSDRYYLRMNLYRENKLYPTIGLRPYLSEDFNPDCFSKFYDCNLSDCFLQAETDTDCSRIKVKVYDSLPEESTLISDSSLCSNINYSDHEQKESYILAYRKPFKELQLLIPSLNSILSKGGVVYPQIQKRVDEEKNAFKYLRLNFSTVNNNFDRPSIFISAGLKNNCKIYTENGGVDSNASIVSLMAQYSMGHYPLKFFIEYSGDVPTVKCVVYEK